jgi:hypothetical protein
LLEAVGVAVITIYAVAVCAYPNFVAFVNADAFGAAVVGLVGRAEAVVLERAVYAQAEHTLVGEHHPDIAVVVGLYV